MQTLEISSERRARLLADSLLAINSRNQEILHGLTHEESQFLIDFDDDTPNDATTLERRCALALRHEQARLRIAVADDEGSADEEYRPRVETRF
ncbi:hypothetical protein J2W28_002801 [Variovorax boronicumulans]|uniref:hypothetical protein n=1 Tax=Variovorax boronicumulans TaxID=436515 RepID=UPI00277DFB63|nr:hypothetical protein [Variovorax boronicumulans]MDP9991624.1 hypothetical protein [Variovorax boronicumulans]MDQ0003652.1 hypothetical protein [Variovorax boronicumulans]